MKLRRTRPGEYVGTVGGYTVGILKGIRLVIGFNSPIRRIGQQRLVRLVLAGSNEAPTVVDGLPTLRAAKQAATLQWLRLALDQVHDVVRRKTPAADFATFHQLYLGVRAGQPDAPAGMWDWLTDRDMGAILDAYIVRPGRAAGVDWPDGWSVVCQQEGGAAGEAARRLRAGQRRQPRPGQLLTRRK